MKGILNHIETATWAQDGKESSMLLLGKVSIEINGQMLPLSEYITWIIQDGVTDPIELLKKSIILVIHQAKRYNFTTLEKCSALFEKALLWEKKENKTNLQDYISFFRYLFGHTMALARGSGAVGENFEKLIYKYQEIFFQHNPQTLGDLEALSARVFSLKILVRPIR